MYADIVSRLRCHVCGGAVELIGAQRTGAEITSGAVRCNACQRQTPIVDGIWDALGDDPVPRTPAQLTNYLGLTARAYEPLWRWASLTLLSGRVFPLDRELAMLREQLDPQPQRVYVDVACSAGLYARELAQHGAIVAGIDHSLPFLREARRQAQKHGLRISYIRASAQALPFGDRTAAGVVMGGSLNEIGDMEQALGEIGRVVAADGRFWTMNLVRASTAWGRALQRFFGTGGIAFPGVDDLNRMMKRAGLAPIAQRRWRVVAITLAQAES